ncbi:MAG: prolipoprotein diacylglyceryl transferase [Flavobacteriales bacterium]|nr:prolipoprotein diacylglyceryl transferase [Flavobacteriales bacterium]MCB9173494.1 prolipoprotein diacylglyceryl transferase [Flavobacteriales bacterium]
MFPFLSDLINYLFGTNLVLPFPMFGFMVAIAFVAANQFFVFEMKRKEQLGLLFPIEESVIKGAKASLMELASNALFGFVIGFKILEAILNYDELAANPQTFILSSRGNWLGGIALAAIMVYLKYREAEKNKLPEPKTIIEKVHPFQLVGTMTFIAAIGGILGAKIFDMVEDLPRLIAHPIDTILSGSGLSIYGGLIIGGGSVLYYAKKKGLKPLHVVDACAPALLLAYGIGRIGCQLSGDGDWGMPNDAPMPEWLSFLPEWTWAFDYPGNVLGINLQEDFTQMGLVSITGKAWPTPFYETIMSFIAFGILWLSRKKIHVAGVMTSLYLILNGVERFFIEKIRINPDYNVFGFKATQAEIIAVIFILIGVVGIYYFNKISTKKLA